jgi:putative toxin-antitoxin system antitoxin component (TIGR02293 family)
MINRSEQRILDRFHIKLGRNRSLVDVVRAGMPTRNAVDFLQAASAMVPYETMIRVAGISKRTLERRSGKKLKPDQSDRLVRIARIIDLAEESIGTEEQALEWLSVPNQSLHGARPIEVLDTDTGAKQVETVLGRLRESSIA